MPGNKNALQKRTKRYDPIKENKKMTERHEACIGQIIKQITKAYNLFEEPMVLFRTSLCFGSKILMSPTNQPNLDEIACKKVMASLKKVITFDETEQDIIYFTHMKLVFENDKIEGNFLSIIFQFASSVTKLLNMESMKEVANEVNNLHPLLEIDVESCDKTTIAKFLVIATLFLDMDDVKSQGGYKIRFIAKQMRCMFRPHLKNKMTVAANKVLDEQHSEQTYESSTDVEQEDDPQCCEEPTVNQLQNEERSDHEYSTHVESEQEDDPQCFEEPEGTWVNQFQNQERSDHEYSTHVESEQEDDPQCFEEPEGTWVNQLQSEHNSDNEGDKEVEHENIPIQQESILCMDLAPVYRKRGRKPDPLKNLKARVAVPSSISAPVSNKLISRKRGRKPNPLKALTKQNNGLKKVIQQEVDPQCFEEPAHTRLNQLQSEHHSDNEGLIPIQQDPILSMDLAPIYRKRGRKPDPLKTIKPRIAVTSSISAPVSVKPVPRKRGRKPNPLKALTKQNSGPKKALQQEVDPQCFDEPAHTRMSQLQSEHHSDNEGHIPIQQDPILSMDLAPIYRKRGRKPDPLKTIKPRIAVTSSISAPVSVKPVPRKRGRKPNPLKALTKQNSGPKKVLQQEDECFEETTISLQSELISVIDDPSSSNTEETTKKRKIEDYPKRNVKKNKLIYNTEYDCN